VGIMVVLSVVAIGAFAMADNNLFQSKLERQRTQALHVAEAGMDAALFKVIKVSPPIPLPVDFTVATGNGTATVSITQGENSSWSSVVSTGTSGDNPHVIRVLSTEVFRFTGIWNMFFASGNGLGVPGMGHINGNASFYGAAYMVGDFPSSNGNSNWDVGPFYVRRGNMNLGGSSTMGQGNSQMAFPAIKVDLYIETSPTPQSSINATLHGDVPVVPLPTLSQSDMMNDMAKAKLESGDGVMGDPSTSDQSNTETRTSGVTTGMPAVYAPRSGYYKYIESSSTVELGGSQGSWGAPVDPLLGRSPDDFAWDATNRILTIQGTVCINAPLVHITDVHFAGKGTLCCFGDVKVEGTYFDPYQAANPTGEVMNAGDPVFPQKNNMGITALGTIYEWAVDGYGPMYSATKINFDNGNMHNFHGAIMAPDIELGMHMNIWVPTTMQENLPPSMPGSDPNGIISTSGWHEGHNH
jgi:hypothetical protein